MSNMEQENVLTEATQDVVNEDVVLDEVADSDVDEALEMLENDEDYARLKEKEAELMNLFASHSAMKAYRDARHAGERRKVTQKEKKKKKAKRRMAKKSRR